MTIRSTIARAAALAAGLLSASCGSSSAPATGAGDASAAASPDASVDGSMSSSDGSFFNDAASGDAATNPCPPYQQLCNGVCISTVGDPHNCGGCGVTCAASQVCSGGACESGCLPGLLACAQSCVDPTTDDGNCGTCGHACPSGQGCANGTCVPAIVLGADGGVPCPVGPPSVPAGPDGGAECAGMVAQTAFTWALCSCTDITFSASVLTDGFNSMKGPYVDGGLGGGVGLDGKFAASVPKIDIGGTLWEASDAGMSQQAETEVHQELHVAGPTFAAAMRVRGDAHVTASVSGGPGNPSDPGPPYFNIDGGLYVSPGATVTGKVTYSGPLQTEKNPVTPPCDCTNPVPVAAIAAWGKTNNDDAAVGLDPGLLSSLSTPSRLDLPCGTFYFDAMKPTAPLTVVAHGHTVILVEGDLFTTNALEMTVDPTGSLDVFVGGTISDSAHLAFGNPNYPALARLYVGAPLGIPFTGDARLAGNLYAAASNLVSWSSTNVIYGSVIAGSFISSQPTVIHYDLGVLGSGGGCPEGGPPTCGSCKDCGNQACNGGQCGPCSSSAQCCAPLVCIGGQCEIPTQ